PAGRGRLDNSADGGSLLQSAPARRASTSSITVHGTEGGTHRSRKASVRNATLTEGKRTSPAATHANHRVNIASVARRGFEPLTSSLKGKRPGPLGDRAGLSMTKDRGALAADALHSEDELPCVEHAPQESHDGDAR